MGRKEKMTLRPIHGFQPEMAKPLLFDEDLGRIVEFVIVCKLYIRIGMREKIVEEQVQWILMYIQEKSADVWRENILTNLELEDWEFPLIGDSLAELESLERKIIS